MKLGLKGKTAFIGGGSKGLGKACAVQLAKEGVNVVLCARGKPDLENAANDIRNFSKAQVLPIQVDLSRPDNIKKVVNQALDVFGKIDILVVNSGGPRSGKFFDLTNADWDEGYKSVLYFVVELYRQIIPQMLTHKWGRIVNIASATVKEPSEAMVLSNVFRTGVVSLAKTLSRDLITSNVTINTILPAAFKTHRAIQLMSEQAKSQSIPLEEVEKKLVANLPLRRFNTPEELADLVVFLASSLGSGINGTTIQIDGGLQKSLF
jgi:3-oxoacyl-[acyl-carrier protein] reductase